MAYNQKLTERVRRCFAGILRVEEKKMFRGVTFMVKGKMCVSVGDSELMARVNPDLHEKIVTKPGCRSMVMRGKEYKGYVFVSESVLKTKRDLERWIGLALSFNQKAKPARKRA